MMYPYRISIVVYLITLTISSLPSGIRAEEPVIFNFSESASAGETIGIQGHAFGPAPVLWLTEVKGTEKELKPLIKLNILTSSPVYIAAALPSDIKTGLLAVWVEQSGHLSKPVFINRARAVTYEYNEIMAGTVFRLFGRNLALKGAGSQVAFLDPLKGTALQATVLKADACEIRIKAPGNLNAGTSYQIRVTNGYGGRYGESIFDESIKIRNTAPLPFDLEAPWTADLDFSRNIYNVMTDPRLKQKAKGNGDTADRAAIQEAIDKASINGGVVYLPAGTYKLIYNSGSGLTMRSRVLLKGDGPDKTVITYGYGPAFSTERVKAAYGWTLGWPDSRTEGMAMIWPGGISASGLLNLSLRNVNESGNFVHTLKDMPEGGSKLVFKNCSFDFNTGWGLAMVNVDQLLISDCVFKSITQDVRNINAPTRTWPWDLKNSHNVIFKNNQHFYTAGRFGANGCHHAIFENNSFLRDGDHQAKGETGGLSLDYTCDLVILANRFEVAGASVKSGNQGETILSQGGNAHQQNVGTVTSAASTTVTDKNKEWQDLTDRVSTDWQYAVHPTNYSIVIVNGTGTGQWRTVTGNNDTTLTIDRPWDVIPTAGSRYVITQWSAWQMLVKDNLLKDNNRGIWFYSGLCDVGIIGNKLYNSEGIYIRADQRLTTNRYNLTWNAQIVGNEIINTDGKRPAYIAIWLAQSKAEHLYGTGTMGVLVRDNTVQAFSPNTTNGFIKTEGYLNYVSDGDNKGGSSHNAEVPGILGSIFDNNRAVNTDYAFRTGAGAHQTVIVRSRTENAAHLMKDSVNVKLKGAVGSYIVE